MRAFIAVELSEEIKREFARIQNILKNCGADITWVKLENTHLTLKFFKEIPDDRAELLKGILTDFAITRERFYVKLGKPGSFPDLRNPKVLWVSFESEGEKLQDLYQRLEETLQISGFEKEDRRFHPHLTLGRIRTPKENKKLKEALSNTSVQPLTMEVSGLSLFQSTLTPQGPVYVLLSNSRFK